VSHWRPVARTGRARPRGAERLAGGWCWFDSVEHLSRGAAPEIVPLAEVPTAVMDRLTAPRADIAGLSMDVPRIMAILNLTPDSFSDGGLFDRQGPSRAADLIAAGADLLDIGGESTRPGAAEVPVEAEIARTAPVIAAAAALGVPMSIDTRKAPVARAALEAGAAMVNDVAAFRFDPDLARVVAEAGVPVCLMHSIGTPETMQDEARYGDVLLDVHDHLAERIALAEAAGIPRSRIVVDPGIGFGKTLQHNVTILERLSLFHGLGCPLLLGASRKRFIGTIAHAPDARDRMPGSLAVALHGAAQGVQITRVHDMSDTRQALNLWWALNGAER